MTTEFVLPNLDTLTPAQLLGLRAQMQALDAAEDTRKATKAVAIAQEIVKDFTPAPVSSGAVGVHLNGKGDVTMPDGTVESWTVSVLVRRTSTIPARKGKNGPVTVTKIADKPAPDAGASDETADTTP